MKKAFLGVLLTAACLGSMPHAAIAKEQQNNKKPAVIVSNVPVSASGKVLPPLPKINKSNVAGSKAPEQNEAAAAPKVKNNEQQISKAEQNKKVSKDKKASKKRLKKKEKPQSKKMIKRQLPPAIGVPKLLSKNCCF